MKRNNLRTVLGLILTVYAVVIGCTAVHAEELPSSYDSSQYGYVTEKRSQYGGTCWAFAAAAAESSLIKSGLADSSIDLSEFHLVYYAYMGGFNDPLGNCMISGGKVSSIYNAINEGGSYNNVEALFSRWSGPVLESDMPYSNREYLNRIYPEVKEDLSTKCRYHLNKAVHSYSVDDTKRLIMQYGAVTDALHIGGTNYINYKDHEYVTYNYPNADTAVDNHDVAVIGWDDNYPKENFNSQPEHDGAWLVKDSDGKSQPYWYVSYETMRGDHDCVAYDFESADLLENNYIYGGRTKPVSSVNVLNTEKSDMNIFQAKRSSQTLEKLQAVMIDTLRDDTRKVTVYVNPVVKDNQIVDYEYKSNTFDFYFDHAGIFKVDLPEDIYLNDGDTFGIEITRMKVGTSGDKVFFADVQGFTNSTDIPLAGDVTIDRTSAELSRGETFTIHGDVDVPDGAMDGISYISSDPDVASVDDAGNVTAVSPGTAIITVAATYGSDRKTCEVTVKPNPVTSLTMESSITVKMSNYFTLNPVVNEDATDKSVTYKSYNTDIVKIYSDGTGYAMAPGTAVITATANDGSGISASCTVNVVLPSWNPPADTGSDSTDSSYASGSTTTGTLTQMVAIGMNRDHITVGGTARLTVGTSPAVNISKVSCFVSDSSVISLNGNIVTGLKPGTATITAIASDSGAFGTVTVTVMDMKTSNKDNSNKLHKGDTFTSKKIEYTVTSSGKVSVTGAENDTMQSLTIPATVKYRGKTYKVTSIGSKAFYNYSRLKNVKIKTKNLKSVGKNAFKGISSKAKITVPKSKYKAYKKLFKKAGLGSKTVWKKG